MSTIKSIHISHTETRCYDEKRYHCVRKLAMLVLALVGFGAGKGLVLGLILALE
jgi:hypothetical protein